MKTRELIDLRHRLSAPHYRSLRELAGGTDMTLRRIARSGAAYIHEFPRIYNAIAATGSSPWVTRRLRDIEIQTYLAKMIARRKEQALAITASRKLSVAMRHRSAVRTLAPPRRSVA